MIIQSVGRGGSRRLLESATEWLIYYVQYKPITEGHD